MVCSSRDTDLTRACCALPAVRACAGLFWLQSRGARQQHCEPLGTSKRQHQPERAEPGALHQLWRRLPCAVQNILVFSLPACCYFFPTSERCMPSGVSLC